MASRRPSRVQQPGAEPQAAEAPGESDVDEAIAAAQSGRARKIAKPKPQVPASRVRGDPERPKEAAVNAKREMSYDEAMKLRREGKLTRSVLTDEGWVTPLPSEEQQQAAARSIQRG